MPSDSSVKSDEKPSDEKNLCKSKSVGQNNPTKKNLRHLRNLRDKKKQQEHI